MQKTDPKQIPKILSGSLSSQEINIASSFFTNG
jgi:hypothetical protein